MEMNDFLFTSESVSEGHPDKVADQISDAILDAILAQDPRSRVAAETLFNTAWWCSPARSPPTRNVDYIQVARDTIKRIGYDDTEIRHRLQGLRGAGRLRQAVARHRAGRRRRQGLDHGPGRRRPGPDVRLRLRRDAGADAGADLLAHRLVERQAELRKDGRLPCLRPDAKSQVTMRYVDGKPGPHRHRGALHAARARGSTHEKIAEAVIEEIIKPVLPEGLARRQDQVPGQPDRPLRHRRPAGRLRPHRPQDHRRHLRRRCAARRRRVLRQGPVQGRPLGRLRRALRGEEHRRRRPRAKCQIQVAYAIGVAKPDERARSTRRHGKISDEQHRRSWCASTSTCARGASSRCSTCCARSTRRPPPTATSAARSREFTWEATDKAAIIKEKAGL